MSKILAHIGCFLTQRINLLFRGGFGVYSLLSLGTKCSNTSSVNSSDPRIASPLTSDSLGGMVGSVGVRIDHAVIVSPGMISLLFSSVIMFPMFSPVISICVVGVEPT